MLGNLHRNLRQVNDLPSALSPTPRQLAATVGTLLYHVLHPLGGRQWVRAKPWRRGLRGPLGWAAFRSALGFRPGIRREPPFGLPFQLGNPLFQPFDDGLLPDDDPGQDIPVGDGEVNFRIHLSYMT